MAAPNGTDMATSFDSWYKKDETSGCWLWTGALLWNGYGATRVDGKPRRAHRVSWEQANGKIPSGMQVLHACDTPACVNPKHLFLGTQKTNMRDMINKGRKVVSNGESNGMAKLTATQVRAIRLDDRSQYMIAAELGVCQALISQVKNNRRWSSVI